MMTKYKVGDMVRVKTGLKVHTYYNECKFAPDMSKYVGETATVIKAWDGQYGDRYRLNFESDHRAYSNPMLELVNCNCGNCTNYSPKQTTKLDKIREYINDNLLVTPRREKIELDESDESVKLPLPSSDIGWTFEVWGWVKAFCKEFPQAYPKHVHSDCHNYQYIDIEAYMEE